MGDTCELQAPPVPPFPLTNITAEWVSLPDEDAGYILAVHWGSPDPVGVLVGYQLWIGRQSLPPMAQPESVSDLRVLPLIETSVSQLLYLDTLDYMYYKVYDLLVAILVRGGDSNYNSGGAYCVAVQSAARKFCSLIFMRSAFSEVRTMKQRQSPLSA